MSYVAGKTGTQIRVSAICVFQASVGDSYILVSLSLFCQDYQQTEGEATIFLNPSLTFL